MDLKSRLFNVHSIKAIGAFVVAVGMAKLGVGDAATVAAAAEAAKEGLMVIASGLITAGIAWLAQKA